VNRRKFLFEAGAVVGGFALNEAIPLGRVWSFPSKIIVRNGLARFSDYTHIAEFDRLAGVNELVLVRVPKPIPKWKPSDKMSSILRPREKGIIYGHIR
jgi:hypothetical protein